ncbi:MAG: EboA domain-containing protein [Saprospiraceae bacterium]|nr:EboA domain-containing protein [Saprospiraceae bacterium]
MTNTKSNEFLLKLCLQKLPDVNLQDWLSSKHKNIDSSRTFFLSFGLIARKIPRNPVTLSDEQVVFFRGLNQGFVPNQWTLDDLCRLSLLLALDPQVSKDYITTLIGASDMREQVVIYRSLPYLSNPEDFTMMTIDGIRTNMVDVFDAIALDNDFAYRHFPQNAWNQMVLKAIFMERPIYRIWGLDERRNQDLADILYDFVHERWSAKRLVTPELWRLVRGYLHPGILEDLQYVALNGSEIEKEAARKALEESDDVAEKWLKDQKLSSATLSWEEIGKRIIKGK